MKTKISQRREETAVIRLLLGQLGGFRNFNLDPSIQDAPDFVLTDHSNKNRRIAVEVTRLTSEKLMQFYGTNVSQGSREISYPLEWHFFFRKIFDSKKYKASAYKKNANAEECWLVIMPTLSQVDINFLKEISFLKAGELFQRTIDIAPIDPVTLSRQHSAQKSKTEGSIYHNKKESSININLSHASLEFKILMSAPHLEIEAINHDDMKNFGTYIFNYNCHDFARVFLWNSVTAKFDTIYDEDTSKFLVTSAKPEYQYGIQHSQIFSTWNISLKSGDSIGFPNVEKVKPAPYKWSTAVYFENFPPRSTGILMDIDSYWRVLSFQINEQDRLNDKGNLYGPIRVDRFTGRRNFLLIYKITDNARRIFSFNTDSNSDKQSLNSGSSLVIDFFNLPK